MYKTDQSKESVHQHAFLSFSGGKNGQHGHKYLFALKVIIIATIVRVRVIVDDIINLWKVRTILFCTCVCAMQ